MAKLFLKLILAGRKNFSDVPDEYKAEVKNLIVEKANGGNLTAKKILAVIE